jgi:hypothetical protein
VDGALRGRFPVIGDVHKRLLDFKPLMFALSQQFQSLLLTYQSLITDPQSIEPTKISKSLGIVRFPPFSIFAFFSILQFRIRIASLPILCNCTRVVLIISHSSWMMLQHISQCSLPSSITL